MYRIFYFTLIKRLILKEENANLIFKIIAKYLLTNVRILRRAKMEKGRYVLIILFMNCLGN